MIVKRLFRTKLYRNEDKGSNIPEVVVRFFLGFLIPYVLINSIILFIFIQTPKIHVVESDSNDYDDTKIKFTINSLLPITSIKTYFQNNEVPYSKYEDIYSIDAKENGTYQIVANALNKSSANSYIEIEARDNEAPTINLDDVVATTTSLTITIYDNNSAINFDNLYAITENNDKIAPTFIDKSSGTVQFAFDPKKKLIVHVEDTLGNSSETTFGSNN